MYTHLQFIMEISSELCVKKLYHLYVGNIVIFMRHNYTVGRSTKKYNSFRFFWSPAIKIAIYYYYFFF